MANTSLNFSQPFVAQKLQIRQRLRAIRRGSLAVPPAKSRGGGPSLPLRRIAQVLHESSAIRASRLDKFRRKLVSPPQSGPKESLEILGFRGWENPAKRSRRRTGWAPSTESLGFLRVRPAEGEQVFSSLRTLQPVAYAVD